MSKESLCLKVPKINGEKAVTAAYRLGIIDKGLEIQRDNVYVYIPITRNLTQDELQNLRRILNLEISTHTFPERKKRQATLLELLEGKLPVHLLASLPRAIDFVGDIAIIEIPSELEAYKKDIGRTILQTHRNVRTVLAKAGAVSGTHRIREFSLIAGQPKTETIHVEHGCRYRVDLAKVYFSPRLSYEHNRVASMVKEGEIVIDMFAGVGPFSILIAKTHGNVRVYAIDINPDAIALLKENVRLNRVEGKVYPILGDAKQIIKRQLHGVADRVILDLPEKAIEFVEAACEALKPGGGVIHFYSFSNRSDSLENLRIRFIKEVEKFGRKVEKIVSSRFVREVAPHMWQAVFDVEIH